MAGRLEGRTALIVGAARGIGEGIASRFVAEGASVVMADTETDAGAAAAERLGPAAHFVAADISDKAQAERAVAAAVDAFGRLDILVQNAGIFPWTLIETIDVAEWDRVLAV